MRLIHLFIWAITFSSSLLAQHRDTVILENFQFNPFPAMQTAPTGNDTVWVNYDQDGLPSILNTPATKRWTWDQFFVQATDPVTGEVNYSAISYSYLLNSLPGNRNWLITPPVTVSDEGFDVSWRSSPSQLPRYMDGYVVLISTTTNNPAAFTDTLFQAASMVSYTGNGQNTNFDNFTFTEGYIHANSCTLTDYFVTGSTLHYGKLEPHQASLAAYAGKTIYIAFLHNSDDDDRLALDDIMVTHETVSSVSNVSTATPSIRMLRNPVSDVFRARLESEEAISANCSILDLSGHILRQGLFQAAGGQAIAIEWPVTDLPPGYYLLRCKTETGTSVLKFIKN